MQSGMRALCAGGGASLCCLLLLWVIYSHLLKEGKYCLMLLQGLSVVCSILVVVHCNNPRYVTCLSHPPKIDRLYSLPNDDTQLCRVIKILAAFPASERKASPCNKLILQQNLKLCSVYYCISPLRPIRAGVWKKRISQGEFFFEWVGNAMNTTS